MDSVINPTTEHVLSTNLALDRHYKCQLMARPSPTHGVGDMAISAGGDEYRSFIHGEGEKNTQWRFGSPPDYDLVNKLFEEGRTQVKPSPPPPPAPPFVAHL